MRGNHHLYAGAADPLFYDHPERGGEGKRFAASDRPVPDGFVRRENNSWVSFTREGVELPAQGFKVHVSATTENAEEVVDLVTAYCRATGTAHKFLPDHRIHLLNNGKYARRGSSGKLLTLYPADDEQLTAILTDLSERLADFTGPYILGDLRWRSGPLFVRYGGFTERWCHDEDGTRTLALEAPDGTLVPDRRDPVFRLPAWVEPPPILAATLREHDTGTTTPLPYDVLRALHFSNGGGLYVARDKESGEEVVLREARPLAGLDGAGTDAVSRLDQEAAALRALAGLECVPRLLHRFTAWEHHYLAEEYIEGETLRQFLARNNPLTRPDPSPAELARYTARAMDIVDQLERALEAVHARGYAFGDLHPTNVMVRTDGRICLIDFETAHRPEVDPSPSMGCPGFTAPHAPSGFTRDRYALDSLAAALFLPLTMLLDLDPDKIDELVDAIGEFYPLPQAYLDRVRQGLRRPGHRNGPTGPSGLSAPPSPELWSDVRVRDLPARLAGAILRSATPERTDRLYPGDPLALRDGGYTLAHGAAGVLHTLHTTGHHVPEEHTEWLWQAVRRAPDPRPGLYGGLHGAALTLARLGRPEQAREVLGRAGRTDDFTLHNGMAGIGLTLHHLAEHLDPHTADDPALEEQLGSLTERLADELDRPPAPGARTGLMHGRTGIAAFFLHRYEREHDAGLLDLAHRALLDDAEHCRTSEEGAVNLRDGTRLLPYLAAGSAGVALTASHFLRHRPDERLSLLVEGSLKAARARFVLYSDLFTGRAGLMTLLATHRHDTEAQAALLRHRRLLGWHAIPYAGGFAFPGEQHYRLSMDLATGTAGVLHALHVAAGEPASLPGLPPDRHQVPVS